MAKRNRKVPSKAPQAELARQNRKVREQVPKRIRALVDDFGGVTAFARAHKLEPKHIYRWLSGGVIPNVDRLLHFAQTSNISPEWVLLGKGQSYLNGRKPAAARKAA